MPPSYHDSFTSALRERLHLDRSRIHEWAEHEKEHIDVLAERHRVQALEQQSALDSAMTHYVTLKMQADCQVQDAVQTQGTVEELQEQATERQLEIDSLQRQLDEKKAAIRELRLDSIDEKDAVQSASRVLEELTSSYDEAIQSLQPPLVRYKHLGLTFEQADQHVLRLIFTQIDANDPDAPFTLELTTNDEDLWVVTHCEPALDDTCLQALLDELNAAEDGLVQFVRDIRLMFATYMMEQPYVDEE